MKIDEPPTPYRYGDDDGDDNESSHLSKLPPSASIPFPQAGEMQIQNESSNDSNNNSMISGSPQMYAASPPQQVGDNVMDVWESLRAKLYYEQQQQQQQQQLQQNDYNNNNGSGSVSTESVQPTSQPPMNLPRSLGNGNDSGSSRDQEPEAITVGFDAEHKPATDAFKNKRAAHYNEYELMKAMRAKMAAEDEEDEDED
jgi:hypothetical protein